MVANIFEEFLKTSSNFFKDGNREKLRPDYIPEELPHREKEIREVLKILSVAMRGARPSNIFIYGKTGTGKTAVIKYLKKQIEIINKGQSTGPETQKMKDKVKIVYINCEVVDTHYQVLANIGNSLLNKKESTFDDLIPFTGWPTEKVYNTVRKRLEKNYLFSLEHDLRSLLRNSVKGAPVPERFISLFRDEGHDPGANTVFIKTNEIRWEIEGSEGKYELEDAGNRIVVYERFKGRVVIALDEVDKLVAKSGDDVLYHLSRINADLTKPRISLIGISNDLKFMEYLDARVKSSLSEEEIIFHPYDAEQLKDILTQRSIIALEDGVVSEGVIPICAALAAQEHGDARRALELLRRAVEIAEREDATTVTEPHVRMAQNTIESNRMIEVIKKLPVQSRLVLLGIYIADQRGNKKVSTGEIYDIYRSLCGQSGDSVLTQRRITDLISELDMLGVINALVISKGRYGRTREISLSAVTEDIETVFLQDEQLKAILDFRPAFQTKLL